MLPDAEMGFPTSLIGPEIVNRQWVAPGALAAVPLP